MKNSISIIEYKKEHQQYFEQLNRYWIEKYFVMEAPDEFVLTSPEQAILKPGGAILMGIYNGEIAGTVALRKLDNTVYEFTKMAVDNNFQRKGIAEALSYASIKKAKEPGATEVVLYTDSTLKPAIALYEKKSVSNISGSVKENTKDQM